MNELPHHISIPDPRWGSSLAGIILELEKLRSKKLFSSEVPPYIFFQLKDIFQILETLWSARIEWNNTTLAEYVERRIDGDEKVNESEREIGNLDEAIEWIEKNTDRTTIFSRAYISELHKIITAWLTPPPHWEWSHFPGSLRPHNVWIQKSSHVPPDMAVLQDYFESFLKFLNTSYSEQYQLLMVAIAHHRFAYIHPFDNGNGRMWRLLNYALLIRLGFQVQKWRIINPSAVFYANRDRYCEFLAKADSLRDEDVLAWAEYFLSWLRSEIEKIDRLLEKEYVRNAILTPMLSYALDRGHINKMEFDILKYLVLKDDMVMKASELGKFWIETSMGKTRVIGKLREKQMLAPLEKDGRIYTIQFGNNYLLRSIVRILEKNGFISDSLNSR